MNLRGLRGVRDDAGITDSVIMVGHRYVQSLYDSAWSEICAGDSYMPRMSLYVMSKDQ